MQTNDSRSTITAINPAKGKQLTTALVAIDGSLASIAAATVAMPIIAGASAAVRGIYVVDESLIMNPYASFSRELASKEGSASNDKLLARFQRHGELALQKLTELCRHGHVPVSTEIYFGGVADIVLKEAEQAQFLVLGRRGVGHDTDSAHLGRNFLTIAHKASIPMLVGGGQQRSIKNFLLAYDNSSKTGSALTWMAYHQTVLDGRVIVLTVVENDDAKLAWVSSTLGHLNNSALNDFSFVSREGRPSEQIIAVADEYQIDLIVMGRHSHAGWLERLLGSTLDRTLRSTELPVLIA